MALTPLTDEMRTRGSRRGFTLIEVLVVVAIIALLIAILLPSLKAARDQARIVACTTNLHDFGTALYTYASDFPPYFPLTPYAGSTQSTVADTPVTDDNLFILWYRRYTPSVNTYSCPATRYRVRKPDKVEKKPAVNGLRYDITTNGSLRNDFEFLGQEDNEGFGTSYEYTLWYQWKSGQGKTVVNWYYGRKPYVPAYFNGSAGNFLYKTSQLRLPNPSYSMILHDADEGGAGSKVVGAPPGQAQNDMPDPWDNHGAKGMSMLFVDGHSTFVQKKQVAKVWERSDRQ